MGNVTLPIIKNFYATTIFKAFVLNALAVALISTFAVEIRKALNDTKGWFYLFVNPFFGGNGNDLNEKQKSIVVALSSFVGAMLVYVLMFLLFGFGGGLLSSGAKLPFF